MYRRERADVIELFKIMGDFDFVHLKTMKVVSDTITRGHNKRLEKRHYKYKSTMNSFIPRVTNSWNALPSACAHSETVNSYKSELNNTWKTKATKLCYNF